MSGTWRLGVLGVVFTALFGLLVLRLWSVQVTSAEAYEEQAIHNQIRLVRTPAPRGDIFDRKGRLLAGTRPSLAAVLDLGLVPPEGIDALAARLSAFLGRPASELRNEITQAGRGDQIVLADGLTDDQATFLAEHREDFPGVAIIPQPVRDYPQGELAAHVLGYIGRPNKDDLERPGVKGTDFVGKAGVERYYDDVLRGTEGIIKYQVDARRNVLAQLEEQDPVPGNNLVLTIDDDVQRQLQRSLADGLRFARLLEMEERRTALAQEGVEERLAAAQREAEKAAAEARQAAAEAGKPTPPEVPVEIDPGKVLGPLYDGLPIDANGVCVAVERHTVGVGERVELSGRRPRGFTLEAVSGAGVRRTATVVVDGARYRVRRGDRFATTLQVVDLSDDRIVVSHTDKWCPVRTVGVVEDPRDGSILAMDSYPTFDPSAFVDGLTREEWERLGSVAAFTNFAVQGQYAPASTFKAVAYMLAMEEGIYPLDRPVEGRTISGAPADGTDETALQPLTSDTDPYNCTGSFRFRFADGTSQVFRDWKRSGHGPLDLHGAVEESCDLYFGEIALRIWNERNDPNGINDENLFQEWARRFGYGSPTGIDLPFEAKGLIPDREWFRQEQAKGSGRVRAEGPWVGGDLLNAVIGQGDVLATPLQIANAYSAMVNGGTLWQPRVVAEIVDQNGEVVDENPKRVLATIPLSPRTVRLFRQDLGRVVNGPNGTARRAFASFGDNVERVGGKTGTGEVIKAPRSRQVFQVDNGLFAGVAPIDDPRYVVVVVVERGGSGGRVAAPIARQVLQYLVNGPDAVTPLAPGSETD